MGQVYDPVTKTFKDTAAAQVTDWNTNKDASKIEAPTVANGLLGTAVKADVATRNPLDASKETMWGQMNAITASDNPFMQMAETKAKQGMNDRGLLNSSMAITAGQAAAYDAAAPIASFDANAYKSVGDMNFNAQHSVNLANASSANSMAQFNAGQTSNIASKNADLLQNNNQYNTTVSNEGAKANMDAANKINLADIEAQYQNNAAMQATVRSISTTLQQQVGDIQNSDKLNAAQKTAAINEAYKNASNLLSVSGATSKVTVTDANGKVISIGDLLNMESAGTNVATTPGIIDPTKPSTPGTPAAPDTPATWGDGAKFSATSINSAFNDLDSTITSAIDSAPAAKQAAPGQVTKEQLTAFATSAKNAITAAVQSGDVEKAKAQAANIAARAAVLGSDMAKWGETLVTGALGSTHSGLTNMIDSRSSLQDSLNSELGTRKTAAVTDAATAKDAQAALNAALGSLQKTPKTAGNYQEVLDAYNTAKADLAAKQKTATASANSFAAINNFMTTNVPTINATFVSGAPNSKNAITNAIAQYNAISDPTLRTSLAKYIDALKGGATYPTPVVKKP